VLLRGVCQGEQNNSCLKIRVEAEIAGWQLGGEEAAGMELRVPFADKEV
jgi:hypothetical protein